MLKNLLAPEPLTSRPSYFWVDTWCIKQDDAKDKAVQIPLMGQVYSQAIEVLIMLRHCFSFSQVEWNDLVSVKLGEALKHWRSDERFSTEATACYTSPETVSALRHGVQYLREIVSLPWMKRIWTAQEYILARDDIWVDGSLKSLKMLPQDMMDILQMLVRYEKQAPRLKLIEEFDATITLLQLRLQILDPTFVIGLAKDRRCTIPGDTIYGLMSAAGVVIDTTFTTLQDAWSAWWEHAVRRGHIVWTMQSKSASGNCIAPSYDLRCDTILESSMVSQTLISDVSVQHGTLKVPA
jgi:hypothetical protein